MPKIWHERKCSGRSVLMVKCYFNEWIITIIMIKIQLTSSWGSFHWLFLVSYFKFEENTVLISSEFSWIDRNEFVRDWPILSTFPPFHMSQMKCLAVQAKHIRKSISCSVGDRVTVLYFIKWYMQCWSEYLLWTKTLVALSFSYRNDTNSRECSSNDSLTSV